MTALWTVWKKDDTRAHSASVHDREIFDLSTVNNQCIHGTLHDLRKVSLLNCLTNQFPNEKMIVSDRDRFYFANILPQYAVVGHQHIEADDAIISDVYFQIDDANTLFHDFDAFSSLMFDAQPFIEGLVKHQAKKAKREIEIGPDPIITYFTGKKKIVETDTNLGIVSAIHSPGVNFGGPSGASISNKILIKLQYEESVKFQQAKNDIFTLLMFHGLLVGRPQNVEWLLLQAKSEQGKAENFDVYCGFFPRHKRSGEISKPHPNDILVDAIRDPDIFSSIIERWIDHHSFWHEARSRYFDSFAGQQEYSIDRLIRSANLFDLLPNTAYPSKVEISDKLKEARDECRKIFRALPNSPQRDTVLGALGRIGEHFLKTKIRHRAGLIIDRIGDRLPDLLYVVDEAVNCRNHFVHGAPSKIDYTANLNAQFFLTDTLEFVFAASDLIEVGWDIRAWSGGGGKVAHPFGHYIYYYKERLQALKDL